MKNAVLFFIFTAVFVLLSLLLPGAFAVIGWWIALSFFILSLSYFINNPMILGKTRKGSFSPLLLLWLPSFLLNAALWRSNKSHSQEPASQRVNSFLTIGRRLSADELPEAVDQVIDLTAEFSEPRQIRKKVRYYNFPILRGSCPPLKKLIAFIDSISFEGQNNYIHCADGHGRTLLFCVIALVKKGYCSSVEEALTTIKRARPGAEMNPRQHNFINHFKQTLIH